MFSGTKQTCSSASLNGRLVGVRYLQKYLKNVQTEHAAIMSGEVVFRNVELRLDVLQEQLGLPLVFRRGFIQELKVFPVRLVSCETGFELLVCETCLDSGFCVRDVP